VEINDTYNTVNEFAEGLFKDKGSKFLSFIFHVTNEDEVKEIIQKIRKDHFSARHHCYAYRLGSAGEKYRVNDDGEPSGTAGRPIYGQLLSHDLTNVLIVVVRYFGGTLLGVSGLINAYKCAATDSIDHAIVVSKIIECKYELVFDYPIQNIVMRVIKDEQLEVCFSEFEMKCKLHVKVRLNRDEVVMKKFKLINGLKIEKVE
jgi:uncharacterized YigZ family protein